MVNKPAAFCWVLQKNLTPVKVLEQVKSALKAQGVDYQEVIVIPFSNELPQEIDLGKFNVFYGSTTLMMNAYQNEQTRQGVFYEPEAFSMRNYLKQWGREVFNVDAQFFTFQELVQQDLPDKHQWFIRPNGDTKAFGGTMMSFEQIKDWYRKIAHLPESVVQPSTEIMIAPPKIPAKEWRCFVVNKQIKGTCRYAWEGKLAVNAQDAPDAMLAFVQNCIEQYTPHPIFVMDVALYEGAYYLLECGCMNSTGFYETPIPTVIRAVNDYFRS
ncbi:MAG TPA: hypothetical protein DCS93_21000 [Microscillaceae bacterium]|nr:hypothetical protein [Microscillaceae bacterium]